MSLFPKFRRRPDGELILDYTEAAKDVSRVNRQRPVLTASAQEKVEAEAKKLVKKKGGDVKDHKQVLGQHILQFGQHRGQTFLWMLENGLGYAGWLVDSMANEKRTSAALSVNKFLFKDYVEMFHDGKKAVELKKMEKERKRRASLPLEMTPIPRSPVKSLVERFKIPPSVVASKIAKLSPGKSAGWRRVRRRLQLQKGQSRGSTTASSSTGPLTATASSSTTLAPATTSSSTALPPATVSSSESQPPATVTAPESTPPRSPLLFSQETLDSEPSDSEVTTGPDSIPGYDAVEHLAEYLVELRHDCRALTMSQAAEICKRWNCLHDYDKRVTKFSPRHKANLTSGRFKVSKSPTKPGVDSTKRCFLGGNTGPAQWPDCNRIVEAVVIMLCSVFPSPVREGGMVTMRWTLVTRAYKNIREKVIQCPGVMQKTTLQLVAINNTTLTQWFNRREKKLEKEVLSQGVTLEQPSLETSESLMEPVVMPKIQAIPAEVERHLYILPQNTAGMGRKPRARMPRPILPATITRPVSAPIPIPVQMATPFISPPAPKLSRTAEWYRKRKEKDTGKTVRTYTRSDTPKTCGKCGQPRTAETGHKQYKGNWHCSTKDSISYEEMKQACMLKFQQLKNLQKK
ncbi:hypothetical protein FSP39_007551 [Pinctada imbricata]|uniref:Uncharacterized protein n=1 Tax=Pinctada imbricata TaxID=66713 RepID=A0AA89BT78_PINIB|nr:hypothetical protein FSP39_007551 [Pinctada imbricata]